jgi:alkylation response protein AidB-like acyl-CoA dehydrogenase
MYFELNLVNGPSWAEKTAAEMRALANEHGERLRDCNRSATFPADIYREMGSRGWIGPVTPTEFGGLGGGIAEYCLICEEVAKLNLPSPQISVQGQQWLLRWGTADQQARYLGGIATGTTIFSESISEHGAASSLRDLKTTAVRDGTDWIITGEKTHVNLGHQSDVTLVYANAEGYGLTAFLVDTDRPGFSSTQTDPVGLRMLPTAEMRFDRVRIPQEAVLGEPGLGMDTFLTTFNVSRLGNASELIGYAERAVTHGIAYAQSRQVGQSMVADYQGIQWTVADLYASLFAASLSRDHAARIADSGQDPALATSIAKKLAIDAAEKCVNDVFALIGSYGLYANTDFAQLMSDVKVYRIAGGSLEVLRNFIARRVIKSNTYGATL